VNRTQSRHRCRQPSDQEREGQSRNEESRRTTEQREQQAFRQQLSDKPRSPSPQRGTNREFLLAPDGTSELQVDDIRHGDEKHEQHRGGQCEQGRPEFARRLGLHRHDFRADRRVLVGVRLLHSLVDLVELSHRGVHVHVRTNSREHSQMMTRPTRPRLIRVTEHAPDLRSGRCDVVERRRHHTDNCHWRVANRNWTPDYRRIRIVATLP
jgi:hypothetical protein